MFHITINDYDYVAVWETVSWRRNCRSAIGSWVLPPIELQGTNWATSGLALVTKKWVSANSWKRGCLCCSSHQFWSFRSCDSESDRKRYMWSQFLCHLVERSQQESSQFLVLLRKGLWEVRTGEKSSEYCLMILLCYVESDRSNR